MAIISQNIENMNAPMNDIERIVHIVGLIWADDSKQMIINYQIQYIKDEIDVTEGCKKEVKPVHIHNNMTVYQRDENFDKIPNENYIDSETTPDELEFLEAPAYDYIHNLFTTNPSIIWDFLRGYIMENYADGWFENI